MASFNRFVTTFLVLLSPKQVLSQIAKPNIVFVLVDDLGHGDVGFNSAAYTTPTIDGIKNSAIEFSRYYVDPRCTPSRSALLSGRYPHKMGTQAVFQPGFAAALPSDVTTLAEVLKTDGYDTHLLGKWHLGYLDLVATPNYRGFDTYTGLLQSGGGFTSHEAALNQGDTVTRGYDFWQNTTVFRTGNFSTQIFKDEAVRIISEKSASSAPFFLLMSMQTIHVPYEQPPKTYTQCDFPNVREDMKNFCNMMVYADEGIGEVINELKSANLWSNTYLIVSTDNGGFTLAQGGESSNAPYRGGKSTLYEGGIHGVGLLGGGRIEAQPTLIREESALFHIMDWFPTLLALADISLPSALSAVIDGVNQECVIFQTCSAPARMLFVGMSKRGTGTNTGAVIRVDANGNIDKLIRGPQSYAGFATHVTGATSSPSAGATPSPTAFSKDENLQYFNLSQDPTETNQMTNATLFTVLRNAIRDETVTDAIMDSLTVSLVAKPDYWRGVWAPTLLNGQPIENPDKCKNGSGGESDFTYNETIRIGDTRGRLFRDIDTTGCPNHPWVSTNPNFPIKRNVVQSNTFTVRAEPCLALTVTNITCDLGIVGRGFNGVSFYSQAANPECEDAILAEGHTFDYCSGHADGRGEYHYHIPPSCLLSQLGDSASGHSPQIGWVLDGLPLYGPRGLDGSLILPCTNSNANPNDCVDECNGHNHMGTTQFEGYGYHYHILGQIGDGVTTPTNPLPSTEYFPYFPGCVKGVVVGIGRQQCNGRLYFGPSPPVPVIPITRSPTASPVVRPTTQPTQTPSQSPTCGGTYFIPSLQNQPLVNFSTANSICIRSGSVMARVFSAQDNNEVQCLCQSIGRGPCWLGARGAGGRQFRWQGTKTRIPRMNDKQTYANWESGQPDTGKANRVARVEISPITGTWSDVNIETEPNRRPAICGTSASPLEIQSGSHGNPSASTEIGLFIGLAAAVLFCVFLCVCLYLRKQTQAVFSNNVDMVQDGIPKLANAGSEINPL